MHPLLATMIATDRTREMHAAADARRAGRGRQAKPRKRFKPHLPRRATQVAHV